MREKVQHRVPQCKPMFQTSDTPSHHTPNDVQWKNLASGHEKLTSSDENKQEAHQQVPISGKIQKHCQHKQHSEITLTKTNELQQKTSQSWQQKTATQVNHDHNLFKLGTWALKPEIPTFKFDLACNNQQRTNPKYDTAKIEAMTQRKTLPPSYGSFSSLARYNIAVANNKLWNFIRLWGNCETPNSKNQSDGVHSRPTIQQRNLLRHPDQSSKPTTQLKIQDELSRRAEYLITTDEITVEEKGNLRARNLIMAQALSLELRVMNQLFKLSPHLVVCISNLRLEPSQDYYASVFTYQTHPSVRDSALMATAYYS